MFSCLAWNQKNQIMWSFDFCIQIGKMIKKDNHLFRKMCLWWLVIKVTPALLSKISHAQDLTALDSITLVFTFLVESVYDSQLQTEFLHLFQKGYTLEAQKKTVVTVPCTMPNALQKSGGLNPSDWEKIAFSLPSLSGICPESANKQTNTQLLPTELNHHYHL